MSLTEHSTLAAPPFVFGMMPSAIAATLYALSCSQYMPTISSPATKLPKI